MTTAMKPLDPNQYKLLTPEEYKAKMAQLFQANPGAAVDVASNWRSRAMNMFQMGSARMERATEYLVGGVSATGLGAWHGHLAARRDAMLAEYRDISGNATATVQDMVASKIRLASESGDGKEVTDPTKFFGAPITALVTAGLAGIAISGIAGRYTSQVTSAALGGAYLFFGTLASDWTRARTTKALAEKGESLLDGGSLTDDGE